jgi:transcriptional regulator with XRE-family HTH domain
MPARDDHQQHRRRIARHACQELAAAVLGARLDTGISQDTAARAAGLSRAQFGRIERGEIAALSIDHACRAAAAVGLKVSMRTFPDGDPARDAGQLAILERFRERIPGDAIWRTEVPLPIPGDRRPWDALVILRARRAGCECETRLRDAQAVERRLALKARDGKVDVALLVVPATRANRRFLEQHREQLRGLLPLDSRQVLDAFRRGELPGRSGIVIV